jgi:hypothetical protein
MIRYIRDARTEGIKIAAESLFLYTRPALFLKRLFICSRKGHNSDNWTCFTCFKDMDGN